MSRGTDPYLQPVCLLRLGIQICISSIFQQARLDDPNNIFLEIYTDKMCLICYHYKIVGNDNFDNCLFVCLVFSYTNVQKTLNDKCNDN